MRAAIYNPYLDTLGGGERYTMTFAKVMIDMGYEVDIEWKNPEILKSLEERFGLKFDGIKVVDDIKRGDGYDLCFWVSDGSIPALKARKNFLHFQVPFHAVGGGSLINKMKMFRINKIICNSFFTKKFIDHEYGVNSIVVYPPADIESIKPKRKENIILFVGRFSRILQNKSQDILVKTFKKMYDGGLKDWRLILAGGIEVGVGSYVEELKKSAKDYPVEIIASPDFKTLKDLYGKAKLFWSASGYGIDENKNPEKVEHFGMTVVEAMAAGAVPIVYSAGGHKEIIKDEENGFLWSKESELLKITTTIVNSKTLLRKTSELGKVDSRLYSKETFERVIVGLI